jgi:penicillin-binding protein 1A
MSLGAGETTVMRMVSAYSIIANGGKQIKPSMIDRIQDRYGKTVYKHDERGCEGCVATTGLTSRSLNWSTIPNRCLIQ